MNLIHVSALLITADMAFFTGLGLRHWRLKAMRAERMRRSLEAAIRSEDIQSNASPVEPAKAPLVFLKCGLVFKHGRKNRPIPVVPASYGIAGRGCLG